MLVPFTHRPYLDCNSRARITASARPSLVLAMAATLSMWACSDSMAPAPALLEVAAGDGQHATAGTELPAPVVVQLRDASHRPLVGVHVAWSSELGAGDVITP